MVDADDVSPGEHSEESGRIITMPWDHRVTRGSRAPEAKSLETNQRRRSPFSALHCLESGGSVTR